MIHLSISAPDEALTTNKRPHHMRRAEITRNWRLRTAILARKKPKLPHAHIRCYVHFPDNRRRDVTNWLPTVKAAVDGCVDAGVLPDDSDTYVIGPDMRRGDNSPTFALTLVLDPDCECIDCEAAFGRADDGRLSR